MVKFLLNNRFFIVYLSPFLLGSLTTISFQPFNLTIINFLVFPFLFFIVCHINKKSKNIYRKKPYLINLLIYSSNNSNNLSNSKRIEKKIIKKEEKALKKNQKIIAKNEKRILTDSTAKKVPLKERKLTTGEKIQRAGEAPSLYSELMGERTKIQLQIVVSVYLIRHIGAI